jgi:hypothetical protein
VEGRWSTLEVVCHLADCEQFFPVRMTRTIERAEGIEPRSDVPDASAIRPKRATPGFNEANRRMVSGANVPVAPFAIS